MRIHHLNTGTMCPIGRRLVNGTGSVFQRARMVCHCLLIETSEGLALVDTGMGLGDIAHSDRLGRKWVRQTAPRLDPAETALQQVKALGYSPGDVRHLLLTHLDKDHAGGIPDFPEAKVHVDRREYDMAVLGIADPIGRYVADQWKHGPDWTFYGEGGEDWFGFKGVRALGDREPDVLMIPLPGHTPGHCGVAVRSKDKWLLHAGDSYFFHGQIQTPAVRTPLLLGIFQRRADMDYKARVANQERLRVLRAGHGNDVTIFNSHDPVDYENCRCGRH